MYGFIEPMEATAVGMYHKLCQCAWDGIFANDTFDNCNKNIKTNVKQLENIILWHYQFGSKFDTPFWKYAKSLPFNPDQKFYEVIKGNLDEDEEYGQWKTWNFDNWRLGNELV